jgi:hypothetical protein
MITIRTRKQIDDYEDYHIRGCIETYTSSHKRHPTYIRHIPIQNSNEKNDCSNNHIREIE